LAQFLNRVLSSDAASFLECDLIEFEPGGETTPQRTSGSSSIAENAGPSSESILTLKPFHYFWADR
jgi:hypothetical protein